MENFIALSIGLALPYRTCRCTTAHPLQGRYLYTYLYGYRATNHADSSSTLPCPALQCFATHGMAMHRGPIFTTERPDRLVPCRYVSLEGRLMRRLWVYTVRSFMQPSFQAVRDPWFEPMGQHSHVGLASGMAHSLQLLAFSAEEDSGAEKSN